MSGRHILLIVVATLALATGLVLGLSWIANGSLPSVPVLGSPDTPPGLPGFAFEDIVYQISGGDSGTWVIGRWTVAVVPSTTIITNGFPVEPGAWARVEAIKTSNRLQASVIELQNPPESDLFDRIEAKDGDSLWLVGDTHVSIGPQTVITGDLPAEVSDLVFVHGTRSQEGVRAQRVVVAPPDSSVFQGHIVALGSSTWQVDDVTVVIDENTQITGDPVVGGLVEVVGEEVGPRRLLAWHIRTVPDESVGWLVLIEGQSFPYLWRVNLLDGPDMNLVFVGVDEDTIIDEAQGPAVQGAWLVLDMTALSGEYYQAHSITVLPRSPKRHFVGVVETMPASGSLGKWSIGGYRVLVDENTGILGIPAVGERVWVVGETDQDNTMRAELLEVVGS
jgi:hypothetical protein